MASMKERDSRSSEYPLFIGLCAIGAFAILSSTMSKNPALPLFAEKLGASGPELGLIAAASTIPGILVSLPAGTLSDIYGRRRVILFSLVLFATAPLLYFFVKTPWQLVLVRFYHGFATAIFGPVANAAIAELFPERRAERISAFSSATIVGRSIAPLLGGWILFSTASDFRNIYGMVALSGIIALGLGLIVMRKTPLEEESRQVSHPNRGQHFTLLKEGWRRVLGDRMILAAGSADAVQYLTYGAFEFFLVLYASSKGINTFLIGIIGSMELVSVTLIKPIFGWLSDRFGRRPVILGGFILGSAALASVPATSEFFGLAMASLLYGLGFAAVTSSTPAFVSDNIDRSYYGSAMGALSMIMDIGQTFGPVLTGFIIAAFDFSVAFEALALLLLSFGFLFYFATRIRSLT